ncbi:MAG: hypothetical protein COU28_00845 [Candidatus Magasanikbacteria bacterium CG10_big_fil_rev_8_21_14_0_10_36_16]|uniref:Uncharacterized protein n=1 Tax=Candidatus Magasanikbacteria bacterium CG10_big_fil_rev_8_21_14_0_10_36_16 TaxID=1974645 RepID=A0A2H0TZD7_9BACT|nr:MAG: hypothetical protein COU28_00845 [Candidatus Magasanikbacteria bacterium CG10_big_fil_rev_8_21_14_0_10_36_16]
MSSDENYLLVKAALLGHVRELFEEIESELARFHEEKFAMLEDALEGASDTEELQVAFTQWFNDQGEELDLGYELEEIWNNALDDLDTEV